MFDFKISSYWPKSEGKRYVPGPGAEFTLKITLRSSGFEFSERFSSSQHEFSFSSWLIFGQNVFSFIRQIIDWIVSSATRCKSSWIHEPSGTRWIEDFSFGVFMVAQIISSRLIQCVLIDVLPWTRDDFYSGLRENYNNLKKILYELTLGLRDHFGL